MRHLSFIVVSLTLLSACPRPLPELITPQEKPAEELPAIVAVVPDRVFAANPDAFDGEGFIGSQMFIGTDNFPAGENFTVIIGDAQAQDAQRDGDVFFAHVPDGAHDGFISIVMSPDDENSLDEDLFVYSDFTITVLGKPAVNDWSPSHIFAPREADQACPDEPDLGDAFAFPQEEACAEFGGGTLVALFGEQLGQEDFNDLTRISLTRGTTPGSASGNTEHFSLPLLDVFEDYVSFCVPDAAHAGGHSLWSQDEQSWTLDLQTPAETTTLRNILQSPECPYINNIDPPAAYANSVVTIFGHGFSTRVDLMGVYLLDDADNPSSADILDVTEQSISFRVPENLVSADDVLGQFDLVVASPVGLVQHDRPFLIMGPPQIHSLSTHYAYSYADDSDMMSRWRVVVAGSGFDISSTAANLLWWMPVSPDLLDANVEPVTALVAAVSPRNLDSFVPADLQPGSYQLVVTTTAGDSSHENCLWIDDADGGHAEGPACVEIIDQPRVDAVFPERLAFGDSLSLYGGPFDDRRSETHQIEMTVNGQSQMLEVIDVSPQALQVRLPAADQVMDGGVVPGHDDAGDNTFAQTQDIDLVVSTPQNGSESSTHVRAVDSAQRVEYAVFGHDQAPQVQSANWLPEQMQAAKRVPFLLSSKAPEIAWMNLANGDRHDTTLNINRDHFSLLRVSPFARKLYTYDKAVFPGVPHFTRWTLDEAETVKLDALHPFDESWDKSGEEISDFALGRVSALGGRNRVAMIVKTKNLDEDNVTTSLLLFQGPAIAPRQARCSLHGFYARRVFISEDEQAQEHVLAELDLRQPRQCFVNDPTSSSSCQQLDWACAVDRQNAMTWPTSELLPQNAKASCLALVELRCPDSLQDIGAQSLDAGSDDAGATMPEAEIIPVIAGLPLPSLGAIRPVNQGRTAIVTSGIPLGMHSDSLGRFVDYNFAQPQSCESILSSCNDSENQSPPTFLEPALHAPHELGDAIKWIKEVEIIDADSAILLALGKWGTPAILHSALLLAERQAQGQIFALDGNNFSPRYFSPLAASSFGAKISASDSALIPNIPVKGQSSFLRRPVSVALNNFSVPNQNSGECTFTGELAVVPGSPLIVEEGLSAFSGRAGLLLLGMSYNDRKVTPTACHFDDNHPSSVASYNAWCLDSFISETTKPLRPAFNFDEDEMPVAIQPWGDQYCLITSTEQGSFLRCMNTDEICQDSANTVEKLQITDFTSVLQKPHLTELSKNLALISDAEVPVLIPLYREATEQVSVIQQNGEGFVHIPEPVISALPRRDRFGLVMATRGALWSLEFDPFAGEVQNLVLKPLLQNQGLPMVDFKLLRDPQTSQVFLYGPQSQQADAAMVLLAVDLRNERLLGQLASFDQASLAISMRPGSSDLLVGLGGPPRIVSLRLGNGEQHSFAGLASAWTSLSLSSLSTSIDGRIVLAVDSTAKLWFVY